MDNVAPSFLFEREQLIKARMVAKATKTRKATNAMIAFISGLLSFQEPIQFSHRKDEMPDFPVRLEQSTLHQSAHGYGRHAEIIRCFVELESTTESWWKRT